MVTESPTPIKNIELEEIKDIYKYNQSKIKHRTKTDDYNVDNYKQSMDFKIKHTTLKDMVKQILRQDKKARTDYTWLCLLIWIKQDAIF